MANHPKMSAQDLELRAKRLKDEILHAYLRVANNPKSRPAMKLIALDRAAFLMGLLPEKVLLTSVKKHWVAKDLKALLEEEQVDTQQLEEASRNEKEWEEIKKGGANGERSSH